MSMVFASAAILVIQVSHQNTNSHEQEAFAIAGSKLGQKPNRHQLDLERSLSPHKTKLEKRKGSSLAQLKSRSPKLIKDSPAAESDGGGSNSSYASSSERLASEPDDHKQQGDDNRLTGRRSGTGSGSAGLSAKHRQAAKTAALVLAPSLESIAMRIVSSAASKSVGRSRSTPTKLGSSVASGGASESFLSSLSSTLISTALSQLNASLSSSGLVQPGGSSWSSKLSPLLNSLASLSGSGDESVGSSASSQSFLSPSSSSSSSSSSNSGDLTASSSSIQPTSILHYNSPSSLASGRPQSPKQYSPTMLGIVNLARYVLCKYNRMHLSAQLESESRKRQTSRPGLCLQAGHARKLLCCTCSRGFLSAPSCQINGV